jgi:hypothetical protein
MVLERPMSSTALLSAIRWALAGRRRQFLTKSHLDELERSTKQQQLMTRELAHRVKNTIAMLQSIVGQTMRPFPEMNGVQEQIVERFSALSRTHDLLFTTDFRKPNLVSLCEKPSPFTATISLSKAPRSGSRRRRRCPSRWSFMNWPPTR